MTSTPAESCTPYRPVRWHDHVPRDSRIQDEGTGDGLFITVLMLRTFKTIQVTQESAVIPICSVLVQQRFTEATGSIPVLQVMLIVGKVYLLAFPPSATRQLRL